MGKYHDLFNSVVKHNNVVNRCNSVNTNVDTDELTSLAISIESDIKELVKHIANLNEVSYAYNNYAKLANESADWTDINYYKNQLDKAYIKLTGNETDVHINNLSCESYLYVNPVSYVKLSCEGIVDGIKSFFKKIWEFIKSIGAKIKGFFTKSKAASNAQREVVEDLRKLIQESGNAPLITDNLPDEIKEAIYKPFAVFIEWENGVFNPHNIAKYYLKYSEFTFTHKVISDIDVAIREAIENKQKLSESNAIVRFFKSNPDSKFEKRIIDTYNNMNKSVKSSIYRKQIESLVNGDDVAIGMVTSIHGDTVEYITVQIENNRIKFGTSNTKVETKSEGSFKISKDMSSTEDVKSLLDELDKFLDDYDKAAEVLIRENQEKIEKQYLPKIESMIDSIKDDENLVAFRGTLQTALDIMKLYSTDIPGKYIANIKNFSGNFISGMGKVVKHSIKNDSSSSEKEND